MEWRISERKIKTKTARARPKAASERFYAGEVRELVGNPCGGTCRRGGIRPSGQQERHAVLGGFHHRTAQGYEMRSRVKLYLITVLSKKDYGVRPKHCYLTKKTINVKASCSMLSQILKLIPRIEFECMVKEIIADTRRRRNIPTRTSCRHDVLPAVVPTGCGYRRRLEEMRKLIIGGGGRGPRHCSAHIDLLQTSFSGATASP
jgi:hypothetical protein